MIHLVTFASDDYRISAERCMKSAQCHGVDRASLCVPTEHTTERGYGFWKWKSKAIRAAMCGDDFQEPLSDGDILIYADAGIEFIDNVRYIIARMDQDIFLFGNNWEHAHWCKRDIVEAIFSKEKLPDHVHWTPADWDWFGKQVQASVIFFRVSNFTRKFVKEWLDWCLFEGGRLIDDSPSRTPNHPEFRENRHDQAIITTMVYRDGIKLHWWPAQYNDGAFVYERGEYPDEGYPVLFHHHRKRNHEWSVAA